MAQWKELGAWIKKDPDVSLISAGLWACGSDHRRGVGVVTPAQHCGAGLRLWPNTVPLSGQPPCHPIRDSLHRRKNYILSETEVGRS